MAYFTQSLVTAVFLLTSFMVHPEPSEADENTVRWASTRQTVSWTELTFEGSKFLSTITIDMQLIPGNHLSGTLLQGADNCSGIVDDGMLLTVHSSARGMGFAQGHYEERILFSEATLRPYKRIRLNTANEKWVKSYCWEEAGVRRQKVLPENSLQSKQPPAQWTKYTTSFYDYPKDAGRCRTISDPSLLLYILSTFDSETKQEPVTICVFGKKQMHRLTIEQEHSSPLKVSYQSRSSSGKTVVEEQIPSLVYIISTETFAPDNGEPEIFSFLGLHENIRINIDPKKRLPLRVSGRHSSIGTLVLNLTGVTQETFGL